MKVNNTYKIIEYLKESPKPATPSELSRAIGVSNVTIHSHLKYLIAQGILIKQGTSPKTYYSLSEQAKISNVKPIKIPDNELVLIEKNFTLILPTGQEIEGLNGFIRWCNQRHYHPEKKASEYVSTLEAYSGIKKNGIIDATYKINSVFIGDKKFLNHLYFLYPYSLPVFGKTKIAAWLFHGKQTQNKILMRRVLENCTPEIEQFIIKNHYDAIAFVPPTVPREIQFMKELEQSLHLAVPIIKIEKIKNPIMIQQKSLKDIDDRIENARATFIIPITNRSYEKVLIIDDFTGSGATLNTLAEKIKKQNLGITVDGLTITGSMNGFEVIKEV